MTRTTVDRVVEAGILVLGSGIAGLSYAIKVAGLAPVTLITKKRDSEANTNYAQGGIAAVIDPADSFAAHARDTIEAGAGLCDPEAVRLLVESGPERVAELIDLGVQFSFDGDDRSRLSLAREGGHSARRIVRADDLTGRAIEAGLLEAARRAGVEIGEHLFALDLWVDGEGSRRRCHGAIVIDRLTGERIGVRARATYLSTGGAGRVYRYTTNPPIATGDGIAMAYRAGAAVANLEFVQFHPTALHPVGERPFLISEAVRGEGAVLLGAGRRPLMDARGGSDLSLRDVVARAIDAEMRETGADHVWLDCSAIPAERFAARFPNIRATCRRRGYDPPAQPLPVVPAAHYLCGGVRTDLDARTGIAGLLAAGEVACTGVHGANRLASNSLLEAVVFADRAAETTRRLLALEPSPRPEGPGPVPRGRHAGVDPAVVRHRVGEILWEGAGIVRDDAGLVAAARELAALESPEPVDAESAEAANVHLVGRLVVASAALREESRGLHFTVSHPNPDPAFERDTILIPGASSPCSAA